MPPRPPAHLRPGTPTAQVLRRRRRGAALPARRGAALRGAARRQRADPQARGRARRPAVRPHATAASSSPTPARRCWKRRAGCCSWPRPRSAPRAPPTRARAPGCGSPTRRSRCPSPSRARCAGSPPHAPNVEVTLETGADDEAHRGRPRARADAVITALPAPVEGLRITLLGDEHLVAAVPVSDDRGLQPCSRSSSSPRRACCCRRATPTRRFTTPSSRCSATRACRRSSSSSPSRAPSRPARRRVRRRHRAAARPRSSATRPRASASWTSSATELAFQAAVLTRPNHDSPAIRRFLNAATHAAKRRPVAPVRLRLAA